MRVVLVLLVVALLQVCLAGKKCKVQVGEHQFKALKGDYEIKAAQQTVFFNLCTKADHADEQCHGKHASYAITKKMSKCYNLGGEGQKPEFSLLDENEPAKGYRATITGGDRTAICPSGSQRSIEIDMICDPLKTNFDFECHPDTCEDPKCHFKVEVRSALACPPVSDTWGWNFIFGMLLVGAIYVVGGVVYNHKQKGLRGMEAVPHIEFWRELPGLVQDGISYTSQVLSATVRSVTR